MKKLLNTLYITTPENYLSLNGENIVILKDKVEVGRLPLHNIQSIITFGYQGASPALMGACAEHNIDLCFMTPSGKFLSRVVGEIHGNVFLRRIQFRRADDKKECLKISKNIIIGKLYNSRSVIDRTLRDHSERVNVEKLEKAGEHMLDAIKRLTTLEDLEQLRGIEGEAAQVYFSVFDELIINQKKEFNFSIRSKRPPLDSMNAILSFLYVLLAHDCASALEGVGLDAYVGFMHKDRPGRTSLALDLMEEFRSVFVDRLALTLVNRGQLSPKGFNKKENGAVVMDDHTRKIILSEWQNKKRTIITHPFLKEKVEWGMLPHVQAMLLARYLRGDLDEYPPFLWK
ncbi:MAG: type I-C CRISPR-associated endonuclease Cas1c [Lachnospiraceae bacterium]